MLMSVVAMEVYRTPFTEVGKWNGGKRARVERGLELSSIVK